MKRISHLLLLLLFAVGARAQTVENIRVVQDGDNLKINYRIGAATEHQLYKVFLSCSMDGGPRFEPSAVIGDVGENIVGGKSYYTIVWDVFADVDEVVNPEFFVRVELTSDRTPQQEEPVTRTQDFEPQSQPSSSQYEPTFEVEETDAAPTFERNGFFSFSFSRVGYFGILPGVSFGSLNNWGYYVTPIRIGANLLYYDEFDDVDDFDFTYQIAAGVTKYFVSGGSFYRLHGYWGLGAHYVGYDLAGTYFDPYGSSHVMLETGVINAIGGFNVTIGIEASLGYQTSMVFGIGFVF